MAAARNAKACSTVRIGPSLGTVLVFDPLGSSEDGGRERSACIVSGLLASGNIFARPREGLEVERSITPRCTSRDGITLSENMGRFAVRGIGNGGGDIDPNRRAIA